MTNSHGWPDAPGVPENPERDGWHWLSLPDEDCEPYEWLGSDGRCADLGGVWNAITHGPENAARLGYRYIGPCLTPAAVTARVAAAVAVERERWDLDQA